MEHLPLSPTMDVVFQYIFSSEGSEEGLLSFLNAVMVHSGKPLLREVTVLNPFNVRRFREDKELIMDIRAVDEMGRVFDVEMQSVNQLGFENRILYYWSRLYCTQIQKGEDYRELHPVVSIILMNFELFEKLPDLHNEFYIAAKANPELALTDDLQIHTFELSGKKLKQLPKLEELLQAWLDFFCHAEEKTENEMEVLLKKDRGLKRAYQKYHEFTRDDELREIAEAREKNERDRRGQMDYAHASGVKEGMEKGMEKGRAEGIARSIVRFLRKRFPLEFSSELETRIMALTDTEHLENLFMVAYESPTLEAFVRQLERKA
ncbi:MAG: Rpn family recombination-promoting nuclease/putative transposase [Planctomycetia bacterium]|nr:Rpn family recombination-promoting nuclease/putative transposase [Planctomycetia bacterium]